MKTTKTPSEKSFGLTFAVIFLGIVIYLYVTKNLISFALLTIGIGLIFTSFFIPSVLKFPNFLWFHFGKLLSKLATPIILVIIFYLVIAPMGLLFRIFNRKKIENTTWKYANQNEEKVNFKIQF